MKKRLTVILVSFTFLFFLCYTQPLFVKGQVFGETLGKGEVTLIFNVAVPGNLPNGAQISMGANLNAWNPLEKEWYAKKIDETHYQLIVFVDSSKVGTDLEYKWTLQVPGQNDNGWMNVESSELGGEIANRKYAIKIGENTINDKVSMFKNNSGKSTVTSGKLETFELKMPQFNDGRTRKIRVWLPNGYNANDTTKTYPVIYMNDGQNLFDAYTSFSGEWKVDETISSMMNNGYEGSIVVGIDNGEALRFNELSPVWKTSEMGAKYITDAAGDKYAAFVTETVKPYIDAHYNTKSDRKYTGIGGSSMGGIMSFYIAMEYPKIYGYSMVLSPALHVYEEGTIEKYIESKDYSNVDNLPNVYIFAGGSCGSSEAGTPYDESCIEKYVHIMKNKMLEKGYPQSKINTLEEPEKCHIESTWAEVFPTAYKWFVKTDASKEGENLTEVSKASCVKTFINTLVRMLLHMLESIY